LEDLLNGLNPEQQKAVMKTEGPVMVVAGAGSGKTRVLTYRIAYLLSKGVDPFSIMALTFTNKAAREMKDRIGQLVGWSSAQSLWMGTFHSIFARILRFEASHLGFPANFTIYDTDDSKSLMKAIVKEQNLDPKIYQVNFVMSRISAAKNNLISVEAYLENTELVNQDKSSGRPFIGQLYQLYQKRLFQSAAMDFDDLLFKINVLFRDFPEILFKYQQKFQYILVDEYQDTNYSQYLIVKKLAANNENVCVVGDDAQSIYAFRGANIENILNFKKDYPDLFTIKLEQNYRSTQNIVNAANSVIHNNKSQIFKKVWTENIAGERIKLLRTSSDKEEGSMVAHQIFQDQMNNQAPLDAFAVLYRTNAQSRSIEESLRRLNLPYRIFGGLSFYKRKEIKDILAYFRLVINTSDEESLKRVINYPQRGIGKTSIEKLTIASSQHGLPMWEVIRDARNLNTGLNYGTINKLSDFVTMIESFRADLKKLNAYDLAQQIGKSTGLLKTLYDDKTPEGVSRFENIEELMNGIKEFVESDRENIELPGEKQKTLDAYMQDIALLTDADENDKDDRPKVSLMTIHQAKGLEFPFVFVVGLEENLFPSMMSLHSRADLEEERRLFYVAITRAEKKLFLSYAESRWKFGKLDFCEPSRFIDEIDEQFLDIPRKSTSSPRPVGGGIRIKAQTVNKRPPLKKTSSYKSVPSKESGAVVNRPTSSLKASDPDQIHEGMKVAHQRFGEGLVTKVDGQGANKKASVKFADGEKQLILRFARLQIIEN
jgi:DNA helicase-2/ATP-dependent DNA helicase PcrA